MATERDTDLQALVDRIGALEARVAALEQAPGPRRSSSSGAAAAGGAELDAAGWTEPYRPSAPEASESWIELHEPSARPQLQRMIRQVVEDEGPITEKLALDRVRRAWGLRRAGGRVQEAFDQAVRQLVARALVERDGDALRVPGTTLELVRTPGDDEATKRAADEVPLSELALAMTRATAALGGSGAVDDVTMRVAKLFGWTRRGGAIQERLDGALRLAAERGELVVDGSRVRVQVAAG